MARYKILFATVLSSSALTFSTVGLSQSSDGDQCGVSPVAPEVVDGSSATMEELVANSKAVTGFIAEADTYLDCREDYLKDPANKFSNDARDEISSSIKELTTVRNQIGDDFNAQVAAYKESNPE